MKNTKIVTESESQLMRKYADILSESESTLGINEYLASIAKSLDPNIKNIDEVLRQVAEYFGPGEIDVIQGGISSKEPGYDERVRQFKRVKVLSLKTSPFADSKSFDLGTVNGKPAVIFDSFTSEYLITHKE